MKSENIEKQGFVRLQIIASEYKKNQLNLKFLLLLQKIFSGEFDFFIANSQGKLEEYSFKECYEKFIKSFDSKKGIFFDVLSPQYLPLNENIKKYEKKLQFGKFYDFSSNPDFILDKNQWEFHLNTDDFEAYQLSNLIDLPPASSFRINGDINFNIGLLENIDICTSVRYNQAFESRYFLFENIYLENIFTHPSHLNGQPDMYLDIDKEYSPAGCFNGKVKYTKTLLRGISTGINDIHREENVHTIAFSNCKGRYFMFSSLDAHCYDSRMSIYFEKINDILQNYDSLYGSYSYFFYIFLMSHGFIISMKDSDSYELDESLYLKIESLLISIIGSDASSKYQNKIKSDIKRIVKSILSIVSEDEIKNGHDFFSIFISNYFLYLKISKDILHCIEKPALYESIFLFLSNIYLRKSNLTEFEYCFKDINEIELMKKVRTDFYENIFKKQKYSKEEMKLIPEGKNINDVLKLLISPIDSTGATYCRAASALYYNKTMKKNDILKKFYPEKYSDCSDNDAKKIKDITYSIQRDIARYLKESLT